MLGKVKSRQEKLCFFGPGQCYVKGFEVFWKNFLSCLRLEWGLRVKKIDEQGRGETISEVGWGLKEMAYQLLLQIGKETICEINGCLPEPISYSSKASFSFLSDTIIAKVVKKEPNFLGQYTILGKDITVAPMQGEEWHSYFIGKQALLSASRQPNMLLIWNFKPISNLLAETNRKSGRTWAIITCRGGCNHAGCGVGRMLKVPVQSWEDWRSFPMSVKT